MDPVCPERAGQTGKAGTDLLLTPATASKSFSTSPFRVLSSLQPKIPALRNKTRSSPVFTAV